MAEKVYEMSDEYNKRAAVLIEMIEARDRLVETIKNTPVNQRAEKQAALKFVNQRIEMVESDLAEEYEEYQENRRFEEKVKEADAFIEKIFIQTKHCEPEKFDGLKNALFIKMSEEEIINFEDRIAILEATRLEEFIGKKDK